MSRLRLLVLLAVVWVLLWDRPTPGQLLAGIAVAAVLILVLREPASRAALPRASVLGVVRLAVWFTWQIVVSNLQVARAALLPRYVRPGVIRVELHTRSSELIALVANLTALSPGMQPIDIDERVPRIDVHVLTLDSPDEACERVLELERYIMAAFPGDGGSP